MKDLFFYGTLRHVPLLEIVLGRNASDLDLNPAMLPDHLVSAVAQGPFPMIAAQPGATADGVLLKGLSEQDVARIDFYEGSFAYDLVTVTLRGGAQAQVYLPRPDQWTAQDPWSLAAWQSDWADISCYAAREVMGYFGHKTPEQIAWMFPMIRARAASQVRAKHSRHGARTLQGDVTIHARSKGYAHFFAVDDMVFEHDQFDGTRSGPLERGVFMGFDAAFVLPYDPVRDRVLLVEQIRAGPIARGDRAVWQLEAIAGLVDAGETPQQSAIREAQEEAGLTLENLEPIAETYPSGGSISEFHYLFLGITDLSDDITGIGGLASEGEDIRSHLLSFDELMAMIANFEITNGPLILSALWLAQHRERLRSG